MTQNFNYISKKKPIYPVSQQLRNYLRRNGREEDLQVTYSDLLNYSESLPHKSKDGEYTLWESAIYPQSDIPALYAGLCRIYSLLKTDGNLSVMEHLTVSRIDYCSFGNSNPFRIQIVNKFNDNYDYFYVKQADASRIYGLELEHILSPNRINYLVEDKTLIEEHIAGIPGDAFIGHGLNSPTLNRVRVAKEFVKFNERCFVKLLGDMRSYNYIIDITPDFEDEQYRIRAIDFDQTCYEGKKTMYLPQYFKENNPIVKFCTDTLNPETVNQYKYEERTLIGKRLYGERYRMKELLDCMSHDPVSTSEKVEELAGELAKHHKDQRFLYCRNMGAILKLHLKMLLWKPRHII
ncbi:MAG: hypothetical protein V4616_09045 [Bacteroidota bacterium]